MIRKVTCFYYYYYFFKHKYQKHLNLNPIRKDIHNLDNIIVHKL